MDKWPTNRVNVIVTGEREYDDEFMVRVVLAGLKRRYKNKLVIVHGAAPGLDSLAERVSHAFDISTDPHPADWTQYKSAAGPIRNAEMLKVKPKPVLCVGFHNNIFSRTTRGNPRGTHDMLTKAEKAGVPTYIVARWPIPLK